MPPTPPSSENKILHFKISLSLTSNAAGDASPQAPLPMLKSTITGTASTSLSTHKKTKGRGFREGDADRPPVSPPATSSPLALTAAPIPRDRLGVKQKEKIASFKTSVDVLTLSATPIPRTFFLADDEDDSVAKMKAAEEALEAKQKVTNSLSATCSLFFLSCFIIL
ncbi:vacuolar protein sorting-associated protein 27 isoform X3 [Gossypium hirsutum]|uniref:Vacuolar protein sorting-associated protein 27 isoform X3 n=1 Tax=Gossypium hirsutum TaxID=3635 RepID=A0ABM2ZXX8_GOSHI|nr:vacuolar protein sorting-associated protein 27-like isoform X3 [Gossypium hirsutum]